MKARGILTLWVALLSALPAFSQTGSREDDYRVSLNGTWDFRTDLYNRGLEQQWYRTGRSPAGWDTIAVPGVWDTRNEYAHYTGAAWYRRELDAPSGWRGKAVRLYFDAVYNDVQVWLNGEKVGEHHVGFLPFQFDITALLRYGESNTLVLRVDNTFKRGAIWNWGGIRRPVRLEVTDKARLEYQHIAAVPDLEKGTAGIDVSFLASNIDAGSRKLEYRLELFEGETPVRFSGRNEGSIEIPGGDSVLEKFRLELPRSSVRLWHFNHPHLYTARLSLLSGGEVIHSLSERFGIRKVEVDGETLKLNGEAVRTVGFNLVAEDRVHGSAMPVSRLMKDVDMMKALGANMARLSHLPLPGEFLDYLDEKGIMTFEEVSLWGKDVMVDPEAELPKYWLESMVRYNYNHPSIIGWSVGNEIGYVNANPEVMEYVQSATEHVRKLDPHRLAVYVSHSAARQHTDPVKFTDMILYNRYGSWGEGAEQVHANHPGKPIFYSEYGKDLNSEDPNAGLVDAKKMLDQMRGKPYLMGASLWTFNDYRSFWQGREGWATPPSENRAWGIVNVFRQPKRAYYAFRREYAPVKRLELLHSTEGLQPGQHVTTTVRLTPREVYDLPAYSLDGYRLVWEVAGQEGRLLEGGFAPLPLIRPGDAALERTFNWTVPSGNAQAQSLKVSLLDPQSYSVYDTVVYLAAPRTPRVLSTHSESGAIRVVFEKDPSATAYKLRYGLKDLSMETDETINHFIDVRGLKQGETYRLQVVAVNNYGESEPSETLEITTDEDVLPPVIWKTVPVDGGFFAGYTVGNEDYLYEIQYGTRRGDYQHSRTITLRNVKGVCNVPGLKNGETYYYRMRRRMQWGFASEWTREIAVVPRPEGHVPPSPVPVGVIRREKEALIIFRPVEAATGYTVHCTHERTGKTLTRRLNASQVSYFNVDGLEKGRYRFEIAASSAGGQSEFVRLGSPLTAP